jgi:hypothetical protein
MGLRSGCKTTVGRLCGGIVDKRTRCSPNGAHSLAAMNLHRYIGSDEKENERHQGYRIE